MSFDLINTLPNREIETYACVASAALIDRQPSPPPSIGG